MVQELASGGASTARGNLMLCRRGWPRARPYSQAGALGSGSSLLSPQAGRVPHGSALPGAGVSG